MVKSFCSIPHFPEGEAVRLGVLIERGWAPVTGQEMDAGSQLGGLFAQRND